jgi:hypothetical protein
MDFRHIALDRVQFDATSGTKIPVRYGAERSIRVQTPKMRVTVSHQSFGTRLSLVQAHLCEFATFLKSIEFLGCERHVDVDAHPLEHIYLNEETVIFDHAGGVIESDTVMNAGATLDIACIVGIDGLFVTRTSDGEILKARLSVVVEQVKVYTETKKQEPAIYINGVKQVCT